MKVRFRLYNRLLLRRWLWRLRWGGWGIALLVLGEGVGWWMVGDGKVWSDEDLEVDVVKRVWVNFLVLTRTRDIWSIWLWSFSGSLFWIDSVWIYCVKFCGLFGLFSANYSTPTSTGHRQIPNCICRGTFQFRCRVKTHRETALDWEQPYRCSHGLQK